MNYDLKTHFQNNLWKYIAVVIAAVVLWNGVFTALAQPESNEKLSIANFVNGVDADAMQDMLNINKDVFTIQNLKEISVDSFIDYESSSMLFSYALAFADVFILSEDMVVPNKDGNVPLAFRGMFKPIPMDLFSEILGERISDLKLFVDGEDVYGIYIGYDNIKNNFREVCTEEKTCIAFFNPDSVNLKMLYGKGNAEDGAAIDLLLYLLESK